MKFGISNSIKSRVVRECTPALLDGALDSPIVASVCAEIVDALEACQRGELTKTEFENKKAALKKRLPILTPHATFTNGRRVNADAVPSGLSMFDIDHIADPRGRWAEIEPRKEELGILFAHVTPSTEGLRLFFRIPRGMDLPEAQAWMARQLGDEAYDACTKDLARSSFVVPRGYVLWVSPFLFRSADNSFSEEIKGDKGRYRSALGEIKADSLDDDAQRRGEPMCSPDISKMGSFGQTHRSAPTQAEVSALTPNPEGMITPLTPLSPKENFPTTFKGIPYATIIHEWLTLTGGEPVMGERNDRLHRLASHLRYICDDDEELMLSIMPRYGLDETEMRALIHSAVVAKRCMTPKVMKEILAKHTTPLPCGRDGGGAALPPAMPKRLPPLIALLVSHTPDIYKAAVAHAVFPPLGAHLHRVTFRYIDNVAHEATLMNVLMAGTGAGKDCISQPINYIMADIRLRDEENLRREREWKNEVNSKGANKDKRKRPEGLVIQEIDADMTNPAFVMRTAEADGHFLYTKMNEIDQFDALRGSGRGGQQFQIMCLAFDPGNRYGQTRVGAGSVTEKVTIRFNWNASTTIQKGKRYFRSVLTDGPISRINFCTIPEREIGSEMPVYGTYDEAFAEELRPYIERLTKATGEVDCPEAYRLAMKLKEECADRARLTQSRVYENLSFRANVIAYLKACVLYVAHGCKWSKAIEEFVRWSLEYDLWCKMEFFGADIEESMNEGEATRRKPGPRNLLELLPDTFTLKEALDVRRMAGIGGGEKETRHMLAMWKSRKYVSQITDNSYKKRRTECPPTGFLEP